MKSKELFEKIKKIGIAYESKYEGILFNGSSSKLLIFNPTEKSDNLIYNVYYENGRGQGTIDNVNDFISTIKDELDIDIDTDINNYDLFGSQIILKEVKKKQSRWRI